MGIKESDSSKVTLCGFMDRWTFNNFKFRQHYKSTRSPQQADASLSIYMLDDDGVYVEKDDLCVRITLEVFDSKQSAEFRKMHKPGKELLKDTSCAKESGKRKLR